MIAYLNPLQGEEFLDLCCVEPIIGARICSWYCCYANAYPFCDLWIIYSDKKNPDFPPSEIHEGYPHGVAARYQGTLCIACDLDVDFDELAEFIAGSGAMEVECLSPIMDELLPRIPYRLRQCIRRCLEYIRYLDCTPYLTAAEPSLVEYYTGLGFTPCAERCSALYWPQR